MKIVLIGRGKMGSLIEKTARVSGDEVVAVFGRDNLSELTKLGKADVMIDFSRPETLSAVCSYIRRTGTALVSGTTGYSGTQKNELLALGNCAPVLWSANFSIGISVLVQALSQIFGVLQPEFDVEIEETHHNQKADAPSGTAMMLQDAVDPLHKLIPVYGREGNCGAREKREIGIHSLRGGTVPGTHTVHFFGTDEELEFTHRAFSRQIFANGALQMARRIVGKPSGIYDMQALLFNNT